MRAFVVEFAGADDGAIRASSRAARAELGAGRRSSARTAGSPRPGPRHATTRRPASRPERGVTLAPRRPARPWRVRRVLPVHRASGRADRGTRGPHRSAGRPSLLVDGDVGDRRPGRGARPTGCRAAPRRWPPRRVEAEERIGRLERAGEVARPDLAGELVDSAVVRVGPAQPDGRQEVLAADVLAEPDRIQRGHAVAGPDRARVDAVVGEVVVVDGAVLVADEPVRRDDVRGRTRPGPGRRARPSGACRSGPR